MHHLIRNVQLCIFMYNGEALHYFQAFFWSVMHNSRLKDFLMCLMYYSSCIIVQKPKIECKTTTECINMVKASPGSYNYQLSNVPKNLNNSPFSSFFAFWLCESSCNLQAQGGQIRVSHMWMNINFIESIILFYRIYNIFNSGHVKDSQRLPKHSDTS